MKLSQAIDYHSIVPLSGLAQDGITWVADIAKGNFFSFDRFITERSFGQKKRIFITGPRYGEIPSTYKVVRTPDERRYLLAAYNTDFGGFQQWEQYDHVYLLQEAPYEISIISYSMAAAASGVGGSRTEVVDATVYGDLERFTSTNSHEFSTVSYTTGIATLPAGTVVTTDNELLINGNYYDVVEVWESMNTVVAKVNRRSGDV